MINYPSRWVKQLFGSKESYESILGVLRSTATRICLEMSVDLAYVEDAVHEVICKALSGEMITLDKQSLRWNLTEIISKSRYGFSAATRKRRGATLNTDRFISVPVELTQSPTAYNKRLATEIVEISSIEEQQSLQYFLLNGFHQPNQSRQERKTRKQHLQSIRDRIDASCSNS